MEELEYSFDYEDGEIEGKRRYLVVVSFDITENKRRYRMAKFLKHYGLRVQRSVYECVLEEKQYNRLLEGIVKYIDECQDLLRIYKLTGRTDVRIFGTVGETEYEDVIIV